MTKLAFLVLLLALTLNAQTLRPNYWLDDDIRFYHHRGALWQFSPLQRPYSVQRLREATNTLKTLEPGYAVLQKLPAAEAEQRALAWAVLDNAVVREQNESRLHAVQRATLGGQINPHVQAYTTFYIDNQLDADSSYIGERQNGLAAFMEQAYISVEYQAFHLKFGRDYLVWGPGRDAALLLSAHSRPMDQLYASWQNRWIQFSFVTATLDQTEYEVDGEPSTQHRYLSGHRLEFRPARYLRIGFSETALFAGPDAGYDFALLNPVTFYTGVQHNGPQTANVMASADVAWMPFSFVTLYGSFLMDDIQLEDETVDDKGEPAEWGVLAGFDWADPFGVYGLDLFAEYTRVTNRTYNGQGGPWEKYLHRNQPIGHVLGNDFDRWLAGFSYRPLPQWRSRVMYERRRRGEGRVHKPFDAPWRDVPPGETYSEPFPTGVVETSQRLFVATRWQPLWWLYGEAWVSYWDVQQVDNQLGRDDTFWDVRVRLSVEWLGTTSVR